MDTQATRIEPRKRPRQKRSAIAVGNILEAAARILETDGLAGFNTNHIAQVAGVSVGSLYQYFPTKDAILTDLIRSKRQVLLTDIQTLAAADMPFDSQVDALIQAAIRHQLERPGLGRALEYAESFLPIDAETEAMKRGILEAITGFFIQAGIPDPAVAARDVVSLSRGMIDAAGLFGEQDSTTLFERVHRAVLGYLFGNRQRPNPDLS